LYKGENVKAQALAALYCCCACLPDCPLATLLTQHLHTSKGTLFATCTSHREEARQRENKQ